MEFALNCRLSLFGKSPCEDVHRFRKNSRERLQALVLNNEINELVELIDCVHFRFCNGDG